MKRSAEGVTAHSSKKHKPDTHHHKHADGSSSKKHKHRDSGHGDKSPKIFEDGLKEGLKNDGMDGLSKKQKHRDADRADKPAKSSKDNRTEEPKYDSTEILKDKRDRTVQGEMPQVSPPHSGAAKLKSSSRSHSDALAQLPPSTSTSADVPAYVAFKVSSGIPSLPPVPSGHLSEAPFKHKAVLISYDRNTAADDISYERLEFLGDAYIELIASRLIFERFFRLPAGQQSQLRELLVKNETLAEFSKLYGFDAKVDTGSMEMMVADVQGKKTKWAGSKGHTKILGDVFEAYVAAVVLADAEHGFATAEKWLTALWAPKLVEAARDMRNFAHNPALDLVHGEGVDLAKVYNPNAKAELQQRIAAPKTRLEYEKYQASEELKGDHLGKTRHYIALYLTGYGHTRKLLGKGDGYNKVEAGNWAATQAMHGENKELVDECAQQLAVEREASKARRAMAEAQRVE